MNIGTVKTTETTPIPGEWKGEKFTMHVLNEALTPSVMQAFKDVDEKPLEMARGIAEIMPGWDLTIGPKDNEVPYPPTIANLAALPVEFLLYVIDKISESWVGKSQTPEKSGNGSAPAVK